MALQLGRGPGQRWMEEAGRRPRSTRSGLGRWMGKKGQQPGTSLVPPAHKSTCRSQERPLSPTGVERVGGLQPASAAFPRPDKWGVGGLALCRTVGETTWSAELGSGEFRCRATFPSAMSKALPGRGQVSGQGFA